MHRNRILVLAAVVVAFAAFLLFDLGRFFSLQALQHSHAALAAQQAAHPFAFATAYFLVYVVATALSVPGAAVLTLAGGALFGVVWGTVLVSFASSVGALLAFLGARFVLRDAVRARFGNRLREIDAGLHRDGAMYLFTLRLVPLVPFFVVNLAMGLTALPARTFYWVSQLGMLAGTVVYVNAGTQLAQLESLRGILSPALVGSLLLLAAFPWLAQALLRGWKRRQVYARWRGQRPLRFDRNLVVIGAGAAGLVSAYIAAAVKASVTLVERHRTGGDCLHSGCVPSKALIRSARLAHQMRRASEWGLRDAAPAFSFAEVMRRVDRVVRTVEPHDSPERFRGLGVDVVQGHARIVDPWTVEITRDDGHVQRLTTRSIVIAAGARPLVPDLPGLQEVGYVTSDTLWEHFATLPEAPRRLLVLGGGPIGCELAQAFARLGCGVTQVELAPRLLAREDDDVADAVLQALQRDGVRVLTGHRALRCEQDGSGKVLVAEHAGGEVRIGFDVLLCAVGRQARLDGYGLDALGIPVERTIETDAYLQTLYPNIYAAGDVAGPFQFTHTASHQAWYATVNALFGGWKRFKADYRVVPAATFVDPEVARVGLNEREAQAAGIPYEVTRYSLEELDRAIADGEAHGFVKVLTPPGKDTILGATIVGAHAAELLAEFVLAMKHGLGLNKILGTIHTYPTWSEAAKYAAGTWRRQHQPAAVLRWLERYHAWRRGTPASQAAQAASP